MYKFSFACKFEGTIRPIEDCAEKATVWIEWGSSGIRRSMCKKHFQMYNKAISKTYRNFRIVPKSEVKMRIAIE